MKKLLSALLVMMMLVACMAPALADEGSEPDWTHYDELIAEIKSTTDVVAREALMHEAEDMLMADAACIPVAYYNDFWLQSPSLKGTWHSPYGYWYLQYGYVEE